MNQAQGWQIFRGLLRETFHSYPVSMVETLHFQGEIHTHMIYRPSLHAGANRGCGSCGDWLIRHHDAAPSDKWTPLLFSQPRPQNPTIHPSRSARWVVTPVRHTAAAWGSEDASGHLADGFWYICETSGWTAAPWAPASFPRLGRLTRRGSRGRSVTGGSLRLRCNNGTAQPSTGGSLSPKSVLCCHKSGR